MYFIIGCILCVSALSKFYYLETFEGEFVRYDIIAKRFPTYAFIFPYIELLLGIAFLNEFMPWTINVITMSVMSITLLGLLSDIYKKHLDKKRVMQEA